MNTYPGFPSHTSSADKPLPCWGGVPARPAVAPVILFNPNGPIIKNLK